MNDINSESSSLKTLEKIQIELSQIEVLCSDYALKERIQKLLEFIKRETPSSKIVFSEMIYSKIVATKGIYPDLNLSFYLLYRNFAEGKISSEEAQNLYEAHLNELNRR
jgi:hypothetical protein